MPADAIFALSPERLGPGVAWLGVACYTLQIYFDFSGYSDMAIGMGRMLGFEFLENFRYPYAARSVQEFWRRWHISLSTWFRDYLYIPLGGNRVSPRRTWLNLLLVFTLCGLWHGASWTFVAWGLWHGTFQMLERGAPGRWLRDAGRPLAHAYVMLVAMLGWVLFRAETFPQALSFLRAMAGLPAPGAPAELAVYLRSDVACALAVGALLSVPVGPWLHSRLGALAQARPALAAWHPLAHAGELVALGLLLLGSAVSLASGTHNPFIYYRF